MNVDAGKAAFIAEYDVSRETLTRLDHYAALLSKWSPKINLVSKSTLATIWHRHFADSAQLWSLRGEHPGLWLDIGSGAGFPGLVLAILAREDEPARKFTLIESDTRKIAFLQTVARECDIAVTLIAERIETVAARNAAILTARAVAPLDALLAFTEKHRAPEGICLFPKGETVHKEIAVAERNWRFDYRIHPSRTESKAAIVEIGAVSRA